MSAATQGLLKRKKSKILIKILLSKCDGYFCLGTTEGTNNNLKQTAEDYSTGKYVVSALLPVAMSTF